MRLLAPLALFVGLTASQAWAQSEIESARAAVITVYERLASVRPAVADLERWAAAYAAAANSAEKRAALMQVAEAAVLEDTFYSTTVLNFADRETNVDQELINGLNDYSALVVGMVRDEIDYRRILFTDRMYIPNPDQGFSAYSYTDNETYEELFAQVQRGETRLSEALVDAPQSEHIPIPMHAGIFSMRKYGSEFYFAGTNRAPVRFTMMNYACRDIEQLSDVTRPDIYVRRDVERTPGGDGEKFRTECVGCHAGMEPLAGAFAYLDWDEEDQVVTYSDRPVTKVNRNNDIFPNGYAVRDDSWTNIWHEGANANLEWNRDMLSGNGPGSFGESIATSGMFPECMAERVYRTVCFRSSLTTRDRQNLRSLTSEFVESGYNMKDLFKKATVQCVDNLRL